MRVKQDDAKITPEAFFAWLPGRDARYELVDGEVSMMAGAGRRDDAIAANLISTIRPQTRGGPCQTFTGDTYIATGPTSRRMPDMGIDCGHPADDALTADQPALIVEVLSPTTRSFDVSVKLAEYKTLPSLHYIMFVDTENPSVQFFWRDATGLWNDTVLTGIKARIELPRVNVAISLADIYDELSFRPRPKLVDNEDNA